MKFVSHELLLQEAILPAFLEFWILLIIVKYAPS